MAYEIFNGDKLPYRGTERFRKLDNPIDSLRFEARYRHGIEPISPEEVALLPSLVVERGCEGAAHYIHGGYYVAERIKSVIERLEPNVHQFYPADVSHSDGSRPDEAYYFLQVGQAFDAILVEHSAVKWSVVKVESEITTLTALISATLPNDARKVIRMSRPAIGKGHLWRGFRICESKIFLSESLATALREAGGDADSIVGYDYKCPELDLPWLPEENLPPPSGEWSSRVTGYYSIKSELL